MVLLYKPRLKPNMTLVKIMAFLVSRIVGLGREQDVHYIKAIENTKHDNLLSEFFQHLCCSESSDSAVLITLLDQIAIELTLDFFSVIIT